MWFKDLFKNNKKEKEYIEMNKKSLYEEALEKIGIEMIDNERTMKKMINSLPV